MREKELKIEDVIECLNGTLCSYQDRMVAKWLTELLEYKKIYGKLHESDYKKWAIIDSATHSLFKRHTKTNRKLTYKSKADADLAAESFSMNSLVRWEAVGIE